MQYSNTALFSVHKLIVLLSVPEILLNRLEFHTRLFD